jgi:hypothetical protein
MALRLWVKRLCPTALAMVGLLLLLLQVKEHLANREALPVSSFLVLLSIASFSYSLARITAPLTTEQERLDVKMAGMDLFASSLLSLLAAAFVWIPKTTSLLMTPIVHVAFAMHLILLALAFLLAWLGLTRMLRHYPMT